jgi:hypothetical protein
MSAVTSESYREQFLGRIDDAFSKLNNRLVSDREAHEARVTVARRKGEEPPVHNVPRASVVSWVRWAAESFDELPDYLRNADLIDAGRGLGIEPTLTDLRKLPEFKTLEGHVVEIRWTRKPITRTDIVSSEPVAGRMSTVSQADRQAWTGLGVPPSFRFLLSLPWFALAEADEVERALHELLCECGVDGQKPVRRKPDIIAHAPTLGRYGLAGVRQASAVAHVVAHPSTDRVMREFGFDPSTGQGVMWQPASPRQPNLVDQVAAAKKRRAGKDAAAGE